MGPAILFLAVLVGNIKFGKVLRDPEPFCLSSPPLYYYCSHRRRINTEEKAKVGLRGRIYSIPCRASCFAYIYDDFEEYRMNSSFPSFKSSWCNSSYDSKSSKTKQLARHGFLWILTPKQKRRPLPFLMSLSFFYDCSQTEQHEINLSIITRHWLHWRRLSLRH